MARAQRTEFAKQPIMYLASNLQLIIASSYKDTHLYNGQWQHAYYRADKLNSQETASIQIYANITWYLLHSQFRGVLFVAFSMPNDFSNCHLWTLMRFNGSIFNGVFCTKCYNLVYLHLSICSYHLKHAKLQMKQTVMPSGQVCRRDIFTILTISQGSSRNLAYTCHKCQKRCLEHWSVII